MTRDVLEQLLQKQNNAAGTDEVDLEIVLQRQYFGGGGSSLSPMI